MQLTCDHIYICFCLLFAYKPPTRCNWLNSSQSLWTKQITIDELSCRLLLTKFGFCWFRSRACEFQNSIRVLNLDKQCGPCALHGVPASQDRRRVLCRHLAVADLAWSWHVPGISHWDDAPYSPPFSPWSKISIFDASCMISPSFPSLVRYVFILLEWPSWLWIRISVSSSYCSNNLCLDPHPELTPHKPFFLEDIAGGTQWLMVWNRCFHSNLIR